MINSTVVKYNRQWNLVFEKLYNEVGDSFQSRGVRAPTPRSGGTSPRVGVAAQADPLDTPLAPKFPP